MISQALAYGCVGLVAGVILTTIACFGIIIYRSRI